MNEYLEAARDGFVQGVKETPRGFFAPVIALFRWMARVTNGVLAESQASNGPRQADQR